MKISEKVYIRITHYVHIYSMNSAPASTTAWIRDPELLAGMDDDLPVHVGHYLWDRGPEGGQGVVRLIIDLSLNCAPHEII